MKLLDGAGVRADDYERADAARAQALPAAIVPYAELAAAPPADGRRRVGVEVPNTVAPDQIAPFFGRLSLIAVGFPTTGDGRGFSLARRLRRAGFRGVLRAVGPLIADQFPYALACGFDEIELPDSSAQRQPPTQWKRAGAAMTLWYQQGYARPASILEQRRLARQGGQNV